MSRDGEYLTSNRRIRYPFEDDSTLTRRVNGNLSSNYTEEPIDDSLALSVFGSFVDALVQIKRYSDDPKPEITDIHISGHTICFSLTSGLHSSRYEETRVKCTRTTDRFITISGENSWCWYSFILSSDGIREYETDATKIGSIRHNIIRFSPRCIGLAYPYVLSLSVYGGEQRNQSGERYTRQEALLHDPDLVLTDKVVFKYGYNTNITTEDNEIKITATPGIGAGTAPCGCDDEETTLKTPGLISPDGHTRFFNDLCYDLVPEVCTNLKNGYLVAHSKCKACCTCDMYASIVNNKLIPLRDKIMLDKKSLQSTLETYEKNVEKWNYRISTALPEDIITTVTCVTLDAAATDLRSDAEVSGKMDRCGFSLLMRNDSFVDVDFNLEAFMSNGYPFEAQVSYMDKDLKPVVMPVKLAESTASPSKPIFSVKLPSGRSATLTYYIRLDNLVKTDHQKGFLAELQIAAYHNGSLVVCRHERMSV